MFKDIINNFTKALADFQKKFTNPYEIKVDPALRNQLKKNDWTDEMVDNEFKTTAPIRPGTINKSANSSQPGFVQPNNVMHKDLINKVDINDGKITKSKTIPVSQYKKETQNMQPVAPKPAPPKPEPVPPKPEPVPPKAEPAEPNFKIASEPEKKQEPKPEPKPNKNTERKEGAPGDVWEKWGRTPENPYSDIIKEVFGDRAQDMEDILRWGTPDNGGHMNNYGGENYDFDAKQENTNDDGTLDIGLFQVNEGTFDDFMRRKKKILNDAGIYNYEQMYDPYFNTVMAKIIFDEQGYGAWHGRAPWL